MSEINRSRSVKQIIWVARIIASLGVIWFLTMLSVRLTNRPFDLPFTLKDITLVGLEFVALVGLILTWWKEVIARTKQRRGVGGQILS